MKWTSYIELLKILRKKKHSSFTWRKEEKLSLDKLQMDLKPKDLNTQKNIENETNMMNTVEEHKQFFTNRQLATAYMARVLYHALGTPSVHDFNATIIMNAIKNNPVTLEDVKISEMIFGSDIGRIKDKTTRINPNPVISDYIEIPQELIEKQQDITLRINTLFINEIAFFTIISRNIMFRTAEPIKNQGKEEEYVRVMKHVLQIYKNAGFKVTRTHDDNQFKLIEKDFNTSYDLIFNFTSANKHVPEG
jgi:hypothetical protein